MGGKRGKEGGDWGSLTASSRPNQEGFEEKSRVGQAGKSQDRSWGETSVLLANLRSNLNKKGGHTGGKSNDLVSEKEMTGTKSANSFSQKKFRHQGKGLKAQT